MKTVLEDVQKEDALYMARHSCRMHLVANFATAADKGVKAYETAVSKGESPYAFKSNDNSGTLRLKRTCCKAFCQRGCGKSGVHQFFEPHLILRKCQLKLLAFEGHRFNISFTNGAAVHYHQPDIDSFFEDFPNPNQLLQSVSFDSRQKVFLAGARAYGIIAKKSQSLFLLSASKAKYWI